MTDVRVTAPGETASSTRLSHEEYLAAEPSATTGRRLSIAAWQLAILAVLLGGRELLTRIPWFVANTAFDPFFSASPRVWRCACGSGCSPGRSLSGRTCGSPSDA
jgi:hypothetical protein